MGDSKPLNGWGILEATDTSLWLTRTGVNSGDLVVEEIDVVSGDVTFRGRIPGPRRAPHRPLVRCSDPRTLWVSGLARIERIPLSSISNEITEGPAAVELSLDPPFFLGTDGWATSDSGFVEEGNLATGLGIDAAVQAGRPAATLPCYPDRDDLESPEGRHRGRRHGHAMVV